MSSAIAFLVAIGAPVVSLSVLFWLSATVFSRVESRHQSNAREQLRAVDVGLLRRDLQRHGELKKHVQSNSKDTD